MSYDDWKLETPEDEQLRWEVETRAWTRRLYGRPGWWERDPDEARDAEQDRLMDHYEECKADAQRTGRL